MKKTILCSLTLLLILPALHAQWTVYDANVLPNVFSPAFVSSGGNFRDTENEIIDDTEIEGNKLLQMEVWGNPEPAEPLPQTTFLWRMNFANHPIVVEDLTLVMRVKGHAARDLAIDLDMHYNNYRSRVSIHTGTNLANIRIGSGTNVTIDIDVTEWNIYRFSMDTVAKKTRLYINENPIPALEIIPATAASFNRHFRFGDADANNTFGADIDWIIWDVTGAYAPDEGSPLPVELSTDTSSPNVITFAQKGLINNGTHLIIAEGANIHIAGGSDGNLTNTEAGFIKLDGRLTVTGIFDNLGTIHINQGSSVIDNGNTTGTGIAVMELPLNNSDYYLFSSPLSGETSGRFANADMSVFSTVNTDWIPLNTNSELNAAQGYSLFPWLVNNDTIINLAGTLNTGDFNVNLVPEGEGWNLAGNPYPSSIDWNSSGWYKPAVMENTLYQWNGHTFSYYLPEQNISVNGGTNIIPPFSGFFVRAYSPEQLVFTNTTRTHNIQGVTGDFTLPADFIKITLERGSYTDETLVYFTNEATDNYDPDYDAGKLLSINPDVPQIYAQDPDKNLMYAVNALPLVGIDSIPLGTRLSEPCKMKFMVSETLPFEKIWLRDKKYNQVQELYRNGSLIISGYDINYEPGDNKDRFTLVFTMPPTDINSGKPENVRIYAANKKLYISWDHFTTNDAILNVYNVPGQQILSRRLKPGNNIIDLYSFKVLLLI